ncbi:arabinose metabolism transcriptional repressor [Spirochaetia bacterium]|nr:arabinose metabolism transcriptional repressor [Spirochaetia bacterium]
MLYLTTPPRYNFRMKSDEILGLFGFDDASDAPKYRQLASKIEQLVRSNSLPGNTLLPGENEFMTRLSVSRTTIRKAFQVLKEKNLIYQTQGKGTFTGSPPAARTVPGMRPQGKTGGRLIGVLVPNIINEIYSFIVNGIEERAHTQGAMVFTANSGGDRDREYQHITEMMNRSVDGLILEPLYSGRTSEESHSLELLNSLNIPVVLINNDIPSFECSKIMQDDRAGGRLAVGQLIKSGHKRIACVYNSTVKAALDRHEGYLDALSQAGIAADPALDFPFDKEQEYSYPGFNLTAGILGNPALGVTAIFYFNDDLALQGMAAANVAGIQIPRDLSIIGYDDIPMASLGAPGLSTLSQPQRLVGSWAADLLFEGLQYPDRRLYRKVIIQPALVLRHSIAPPHG